MRVVAVIEFEFDFTSNLDDTIDIIKNGEYFPDNVIGCNVHDVNNSIEESDYF